MRDKVFYQNELKKSSRLFERHVSKKFTSQSLYLIEKHFFLSAYLIRKLLENGKLSSEVEASSINISGFKCEKKMPPWGIHYNKYFNFQKPDSMQKGLKALVNLLIHSVIFEVEINEGTYRPESVLFTSDKEKNKYIFSLSIIDYSKLLSKIADDHPVNIKYTVDSNGEYIKKISSKKNNR